MRQEQQLKMEIRYIANKECLSGKSFHAVTSY